MRNIELEEGEAYFFPDDDDENIDPDTDLSYIDQKVENLLGQYRKDFMRECSAESLGPRYGGYGSFLPMYERSPPLLPTRRTPSQFSSKSHPNLPSGVHTNSSGNSTGAVNPSLPAKTVPVSDDQSGKHLLGSGISAVNNVLKSNNSTEHAFNRQQQPNKPIMPHSEQKPLKLRVTMASKNVLSGNNAAIYSGLGLDMSPMSSSEGTPSTFDETLPDIQETKQESPSGIIKIMTAVFLPDDTLVSPLHDDLLSLTKVEKSLDTNLPGIRQAEALNIVHDSSFLEGNIEANLERKPNLKDTRKENTELKEESTERKPKQNMKKHKPAESVIKDNKIPANSSEFDATRGKEIGASVRKKTVCDTSINPVDGGFKEVGKFSAGPSIVLDKKSEVGCVVEETDSYTKQGQITQVSRHKVKDEFALVSSDAAAVDEGNSSKMRSKCVYDSNQIAIPDVDKRNNFGHGEHETNTFLKQNCVVKDTVKEEDFSPGYPKESEGYRKGSAKKEKIAKEKEVDNKHVGSHQLKKQYVSEKIESSKQKLNIKAMPHLQMDPSLEESPSSLVKKKLKERQIGYASSTEPPRGSVISSSGPEGEDVGKNVSSQSKRGDLDLPKETRKDSDGAVIEKPSKKGKESSLRESVMGPSVRDGQPSVSKTKDQLSNKKTNFANVGPKLEGPVAVSNMREKAPVGELVPPANDPLVPLEMDDWVQCEKCQKWRLLPFGTNPDSLPKEWICSMLTWLPGMNKCSVSEDETTLALRTLYLPSALGPALPGQNNQHAHLDAYQKVSTGIHNVGRSNLVPSADVVISSGKKKNVPKLEFDAAGRSAAQDLHRPIKKDPQHSGGITISKQLKKLPLESACTTKSAAGAGRPSKNPKKRTAEAEVSGVPKKMKNVHQQSTERPIVVGLLPPEAKGGSQNYNLDPSRTSRDFNPEIAKCLPSKVRYGVRDEENDGFEKKRKSKDQQRSVKASEAFVKGQRPLNNLLLTNKNSGPKNKIEAKINPSNIEARESREDMRNHKTKGNSRKHNPDCASDNQPKSSRIGQNTQDRVSRKAAEARISSEKALDLGLSDNATTSSSSKVSTRVKAKASEVKCSPAGSISSSPMKAYNSESEKGTSKVVVSYNEPEQMSSRKRLKASAEGAGVTHEAAQHNDEIKGRKSNLSRISGVTPNAAQEDHFSKKVSSGRHSIAQSVDSQPKCDDFDCHDSKLDDMHREGRNVASQGTTKNQMPNGLHFDGTSLDRPNLLAPDMGGDKERSICAHSVSDFEKGSGSDLVRFNNGDEKLSTPVLDDHVSLRRPDQAAQASKDTEASSSKKVDSFHIAAKTALKEAKDLKHSANRLKTSGSGLSTGLFFQAALKFLHGASLLEPGTTENGRIGEMKSNEVYSSTAKLCEYCAHEYEKCNDMASAALAYKCMEVAYMRVVYDNDIAASRDRMEVQMAVRAAPQVESPSSSASDIDNLNNQMAVDTVKDVHSMIDHRSHVISARNRPNFVRLLNFTHDINLAMDASRRSQSAFAVANPILSQAGNEEGISSIKRVLDFSFHDVDGLLHLVRLAMEALNS